MRPIRVVHLTQCNSTGRLPLAYSERHLSERWVDRRVPFSAADSTIDVEPLHRAASGQAVYLSNGIICCQYDAVSASAMLTVVLIAVGAVIEPPVCTQYAACIREQHAAVRGRASGHVGHSQLQRR